MSRDSLLRFCIVAAALNASTAKAEQGVEILPEDTSVVRLTLPEGTETRRSLRHSFKTICINAGIPREVVDAWQGHSPDRSAGSAFYRLSDEESQRFMKEVPFGTGKSAADVGDKES